MNARRVMLAVCVLALSMSLVGCSKVTSFFNREPDVITQEATAAALGASLDGQLPEGLSEDLPLWPGATVRDGEVGDVSQMLLLDTDESYEDVVAGVAVGFERAGWKAAQVSEEGSATVLEVSNEEFDGLVTIYGQEPGTTIEYLLTPKK